MNESLYLNIIRKILYIVRTLF